MTLLSSPRVWLAIALALAPVAVIGVVPTGAGQSGPTAVNECTEITESGHYVIERNQTYTGTVGSTACLTIRADDVVLDGRGTVFDGRGISNTTGVRVVGASNVTIRNLTVTDWHEGVHFVRADGGAVRNVRVSQSPYGVTVERSRGVTVTRSRFVRNLVGVQLEGAEGTTLRNNTFRDNHGTAVHRTSGAGGN